MGSFPLLVFAYYVIHAGRILLALLVCKSCVCGTKLCPNLPQQKHAQTYYIELALAPARVQMQMNSKRNVVLYLDREPIEKRVNWGLIFQKPSKTT